ncbi:MAG: hypothetical protein WD080_05460 [Egibacteraceae bacterium]
MNPKLVRTGLFAAVALVALAATAWACVPVATLEATPGQASPGDEITVNGRFYNANDVTLHWDGLDGRVLGTVTPENRLLEGTVRVPSDTAPGNYTLVATQESEDGSTTWGIPSRALVTVVGEGGEPVLGAAVGADASERAPELMQTESVGAGEFVLVALGITGFVLFAAGAAALMAGRSRRAVAETATSE